MKHTKVPHAFKSAVAFLIAWLIQHTVQHHSVHTHQK